MPSTPSSFSKFYRLANSKLRIDVICGPDEIYDIIGVLGINDVSRIPIEIIKSEMLTRTNIEAISSSSMKRTAGSLGMPGGVGGMHNLNLPTNYPGPRWWPADMQNQDIDELQSWIREQYRYNPEYMAIGDALSSGQDMERIVAKIPYPVSYAKLVIDRQEPMVEYTTTDGRVGRQKINTTDGRGGIGHGDIAQEIDKYNMRVKPSSDGGTDILLKKRDARGDAKGIWQINGPPEVPGFAFVWEDWRTGYGLHPEFLDDKEWSSGKWAPGTQRWHPFS